MTANNRSYEYYEYLNDCSAMWIYYDIRMLKVVDRLIMDLRIERILEPILKRIKAGEFGKQYRKAALDQLIELSKVRIILEIATSE